MRPKTVLTVGEAAAITGASPRTVSKWCDGGSLPSYRIPGSFHRRIFREALEKFMNEHGMNPPPAAEPEPAPAKKAPRRKKA